MTTEYKDLKVHPVLRDILHDTATREYGQEYRAISRSGHEAVIAWLVLRADDDIVQDTLDDHGFDSIPDLVDFIQQDRFETDDHFDPLAAIRHPTNE
jgi:hypothetical protein